MTPSRQQIGESLKERRLGRGLSAYKVAQQGGIRIDQVKVVETGDTNYTIDLLLGYLKGCELNLNID